MNALIPRSPLSRDEAVSLLQGALTASLRRVRSSHRHISGITPPPSPGIPPHQHPASSPRPLCDRHSTGSAPPTLPRFRPGCTRSLRSLACHRARSVPPATHIRSAPLQRQHTGNPHWPGLRPPQRGERNFDTHKRLRPAKPSADSYSGRRWSSKRIPHAGLPPAQPGSDLHERQRAAQHIPERNRQMTADAVRLRSAYAAAPHPPNTALHGSIKYHQCKPY